MVGQDRGGAVLRGGSYWDRDSSGISESGGGAGKTSAELRSPTANTGIYGAWSSTAWDFGTSGQYPALKADWNGDGTATWQEFGNQRTPDAPTIGRVVWKSAESGLQLQVSWSAPSWDGGSPITAYDVRYIAADAEKALPANWTLLDSAWTSGSLEYGITGLQPGRRVVQVRGVNANGKGRWSAGGTLTGNNPPSFKETAPARTVAENTIAEMSIGEPVSATDPDGDALTYRLTGTEAAAFTIDASTGQLKTNAPLNYEKKPSYVVAVEVSDGSGTASVNVTITVTDANDPPLAQADTATANESTAVTIAVLDNDSDEDAGATVSVAAVTQPTGGSVALDSTGVVTYTPNAGFHGSDSFTYTLTDGTHSVVGDGDGDGEACVLQRHRRAQPRRQRRFGGGLHHPAGAEGCAARHGRAELEREHPRLDLAGGDADRSSGRRTVSVAAAPRPQRQHPVAAWQPVRS